MPFCRAQVICSRPLRSSHDLLNFLVNRAQSAIQKLSVNSAAWKLKISWTPAYSKAGNFSYSFTGWPEDIFYFVVLVGKSSEVTNCLRWILVASVFQRDLFIFAVQLAVLVISSIHWQEQDFLVTSIKDTVKSAVCVKAFEFHDEFWSSGCKSMVVIVGIYSMCIFRCAWVKSCGCPGAFLRAWRISSCWSF